MIATTLTTLTNRRIDGLSMQLALSMQLQLAAASLQLQLRLLPEGFSPDPSESDRTPLEEAVL